MQNSSAETVADTIIQGVTQAPKIPTSLLRGRVIGKYLDAKIYDQFTDNHGQVWLYSGVTTKTSDCKLGVIILKPGLVYAIAEPCPTASSGGGRF